MALGHSPSIVTSGLVLYYDFGNFEKAFGTTNLGLNNALTIYNNVPSHVTATLTQTSNTYRGSPIWVQTLTPTTATGVSYLTAGNNPGIGVYHNNGGGTGGTYTGHSIFFRSTVPMHSSPIFTHYSNIAGYQSQTNYDDMRDGWYRANVVWYDTVTRGDAKYWAINPASATLNVPITIYWAAPFREDRNYTNFVSAYSSGTRGSGSGALNLISDTTLSGTLTNNPTYNSSNGGSLVFNGTNQYIDISTALSNQFSGKSITVSTFAKISSVVSKNNLLSFNGAFNFFLPGNRLGPTQQLYWDSTTGWKGGTTTTWTTNQWYNLVWVISSGKDILFYINGSLDYTSTIGVNFSPTSNAAVRIGLANAGEYATGNIAMTQIYNRALTASEVAQNFNAHRGRYGV